jgi:hypothetical protein
MHTILDSMQRSINDEDTHPQYYENTSASLTTTVPHVQPESSVLSDECLELEEGNGHSLDHQTPEKDDAPTTECVTTAEEGGQLPDEQKEVSYSHPGQEMNMDSEGAYSSQSATQIDDQDNQQSVTVTQLEGQDNMQSATQIELQESQLQSSATKLELQDSQQLAEHREGHVECFKMAEESGKELVEEGEEFQENKSDREVKHCMMNPEVEGGNTSSAVADEEHMALSEGHYQEPRTAKILNVRVESVTIEEAETEEGI